MSGKWLGGQQIKIFEVFAKSCDSIFLGAESKILKVTQPWNSRMVGHIFREIAGSETPWIISARRAVQYEKKPAGRY
jgi:hypothetical protein